VAGATQATGIYALPCLVLRRLYSKLTPVHCVLRSDCVFSFLSSGFAFSFLEKMNLLLEGRRHGRTERGICYYFLTVLTQSNCQSPVVSFELSKASMEADGSNCKSKRLRYMSDTSIESRQNLHLTDLRADSNHIALNASLGD